MIVSISNLCPVYRRAHAREPYLFSHWWKSPSAHAVPDGLTVEQLRQYRAEKGRARGMAWRAPLMVLVSGDCARVCTRSNSWWEDDGHAADRRRYDAENFPPADNELDGCSELASGHMFAPAFATLATYEERADDMHRWTLCCVHAVPSGGVVLPRVIHEHSKAKVMRKVRMGFKRAMSRAERVSAWLVGRATARGI